VRSMTICVPSYQRRDSLVRLLLSIDHQARENPEIWSGIDVVVTLDGSTDGSEGAVSSLDLNVPVQVCWQENSGPAAARNSCLVAAKGELTWFLDDDLVPTTMAARRHRSAHEMEENTVFLGPCVFPDDLDVPPAMRAWWNGLNQKRAEAGRIEHLDELPVGIANLSGPTQLFRDIGGFDESFVGYGLEDTDFAVRIIDAGMPMIFDLEAVCWHVSSMFDEAQNRSRRREEGRNTVRLVKKHPHIVSTYLPSTYTSPAARLLDRLRVRSPHWLMFVSTVSAWAAVPVSRIAKGRGQFLRSLAFDAAYAAGIVDVDPRLLPRALGRPASGE
jgi:GT2 family glycosyltransferase